MNRYKHSFYYDWHNGVISKIEAYMPLIMDDFCIYCSKSICDMYIHKSIEVEDRINVEQSMNEEYPCLTKDEYAIKKLLE